MQRTTTLDLSVHPIEDGLGVCDRRLSCHFLNVNKNQLFIAVRLTSARSSFAQQISGVVLRESGSE